MKNIFLILFVLIFVSLNSCKEKKDTIVPVADPNSLDEQFAGYKTYIDTNLKTNAGVYVLNEANKEYIVGYGTKAANGKLASLESIVLFSEQTHTTLSMSFNSNELVSKVEFFSDNGKSVLSLTNYDLAKKTVEGEIIGTNKEVLLPKIVLPLSDDLVELINYSKKKKEGRLSSKECHYIIMTTLWAAGITCFVTTTIVQAQVCKAISVAGIAMFVRCNSVFTLIKVPVCSQYSEAYERLALKCENNNEPLPPLPKFGCIPSAIASSTSFQDFYDKWADCSLPPNKTGYGWGDPHLSTHDGISYDFQGHGEFISTRSTVDNFEIQVRQEDVYKTGHVTMNTGIAVQTGTDVVCVTVKPYKLFVNKQSQDLISLTTLPLKDGASITKIKQNNLDALNITNKNGDVVKVVFQNVDYLDYFTYLADNRKSKVMGLMGNYDADKNNDIQTSTGENILVNGSLSFDKLYSVYSDSWRITPSNSLFYYDGDKNTGTYTQKNFPRTLQTLTAAQKANAESVCRSAGVTLEPFLSNCIYDVAVTNNPALTNSALVAQANASNTISSPVTITPPSNSATTIDFNDIKQIELKGSAKVVNGCIRLTDASFNIVGAAYYKSIVSGDFESEFTFKISELKSGGADGFTFIMSKDIPALTIAEGIGYQGTKSSLVVEFDTWQNTNLGDPNDNHISIHTNGQDANSANERFSIGSNDKIINLSDGKEHKVKVVYQNKTMEIFLDGSSIIKAPIDLINKLGLNGSFYIGFTAATGGASEIHDICSWTIKSL